MDTKRLTTTILMVFAVLIIWNQFFAPTPPPKKKDAPTNTEEQGATPGPNATTPQTPQTPQISPGRITEGVVREELRNDVLRVQFSNLGAVLEQAELLDTKPTAQSPDGTPLKLVVPSPSGFNSMRMETTQFPGDQWGNSLWEGSRSADGRTLTYTHTVTRGREPDLTDVRITKSFTLQLGDARYLNVEVRTEVLTEGRTMASDYSLLVSGGVFEEVGGATMSPPRSAIFPFEGEVDVLTAGRDSDRSGLATDLLERRGSPERRGLGTGRRFAADLTNYHGMFLLMQEFPSNVTTATHYLSVKEEWPRGRDDSGGKSHRTATVVHIKDDLIYGSPHTWKGILYMGPVETEHLAANLDGVVTDEEVQALGSVYEDQLGWARSVSRVILWVLRKIHSVVGNWGWAIVILTFIVRLVLFPINRRSQRAMLAQQEGMNRVKPELDRLKKKHEDDPKKFMEAQMALFRREKVSMVPLGGCLPIFLQIPVFFGLFSALRASLDLRQAPWLWVEDLSQPDHLVRFAGEGFSNPLGLISGCCGASASNITGFHILPILMIIAWVANSYFMPRPTSTSPEQEQMRKMMMFMPIMFGLFMYSYAAGLSLYWLTSSLLGLVETNVIKKIWPVTPQQPKKAA